MERKGFGIRFVAYLIDLVIMIFVIGGFVSLIIAGSFTVSMGTPNTTAGQAATAGAMRTATILGTLLALGYASLEIFMAQSVGKMLLKLKIADQSGAPAPMNQLITRYAIKYSASLIGLIVAITGIAVLGWLQTAVGLVIFVGCFLAFGQARQALHDMLAKTAVFGAATATAAGFSPIMSGSTPPPPPPAG